MNIHILPRLTQFGDGFIPVATGYEDPSTQGGALSNLTLIISNMLGFATIVGGLFFVMYFIMAAYKWLGSNGDPNKLSESRNQMVHGVIGLLIIVAAYSIIGLVGTLLSFDLLNPAERLCTIIPGGCS